MGPRITRITRVFRDQDGKVCVIHCGSWPNVTAYRRVIHCGSWPNVTAYRRVILGGERYFMLAAYGKSKLYRPNRETRCMDYVGRA